MELSQRATPQRTITPPAKIPKAQSEPKGVVWRVATVAALLAFGWCAFIVRTHYQGNWTGLFCIGEVRSRPPELSPGVYLFSNSQGFDGQYYRLIAHDPFLQRGFARYIDAPRLRYRRSLTSIVAWLFALGREDWIDLGYFVAIWLAVFAGTYWLGCFARAFGHSAWWGLSYLLLPSTAVSLDRMLTDLPMVTLGLGFLWEVRRKRYWSAWILIAAACLARETGVLFLVGYCVYLVISHRDWKRAALFATAVAPLGLWSLYVEQHANGTSYPGHVGSFMVAIQQVFPDPIPYTEKGFRLLVLHTWDAVALFAMIACWILVWVLRRRPLYFSIGFLFALLGFVMASRTDSTDFVEIGNYGRYYSPLLLLYLLNALEVGGWAVLAPTFLVVSREGFNLFGELLAGLRSLRF